MFVQVFSRTQNLLVAIAQQPDTTVAGTTKNIPNGSRIVIVVNAEIGVSTADRTRLACHKGHRFFPFLPRSVGLAAPGSTSTGAALFSHSSAASWAQSVSQAANTGRNDPAMATVNRPSDSVIGQNDVNGLGHFLTIQNPAPLGGGALLLRG